MLLRPPSRLPWKIVRARGLDMEQYDRGRIVDERGRSWRLRRPFLCDQGDDRHSAYMFGLRQLAADIGEHRLARIKTRFGRVVAIGHAVPHHAASEIPILEALGLDVPAIYAWARNRMVWDAAMEPDERPCDGLAMSDSGRLQVRVEITDEVVYRIGAFSVSPLPETLRNAIVGMPLHQVLQCDGLADIGLVIHRVDSMITRSLLVVCDTAQTATPPDARLTILDGQVREIKERKWSACVPEA